MLSAIQNADKDTEIVVTIVYEDLNSNKSLSSRSNTSDLKSSKGSGCL